MDGQSRKLTLNGKSLDILSNLLDKIQKDSHSIVAILEFEYDMVALIWNTSRANSKQHSKVTKI